ncbi:tetratricopeptide repeat protein [Bacteroides sp.]|uniref:tetratricopeptide repeat protein n=1 Tax=Bacteroides sp. TaxID=29523 RepID=UPI003A8C8E19
MKYNILATLLFAIYLLIACTHSGRDSKLVQAETLMQKFPDSALHLLQEIRPEELNSLEDQAYHALLLTEVKDKNFIQQTEDSLIRIAVQYYDSTKNIPMQARSYYYLGCIWRDKDNHPEALKEFFKAIFYSKKANDNKLTGYIYNNIANLYLSQRLNEQADSIYQITEKLAIQEKDSNLWADVLSQRGTIDINRGKRYYNEAEQKILTAFKVSCHIAQKSMIAKTAYSLSLLYGRMNMGEKAVKFAKLNIIHQDNPNVTYRDFLILGEAYYKVSQYDSALIFLNKSLCSDDNYTKAGAYMRLADIAQKQGNLKKALEMERKYSAHLDSAQQKQQSAAIVTTEKNILIQRKQSEFKTNLEQLYCYIATGTAFFLASFLVLLKCYKRKVIYYKQKEMEMSKKLEEMLRQKNEQISFLQKEIAQHRHSQTEKQTLKEELHTLKTERQALLKESYEHSGVCVKMKRIIQSYKKTDKSNERFDEEDWKQLIAETDIRWNDITIRLAAKYPLSQDEIYLCCLHLTDIPTSHFRYLMECSRDAIYKKTKRILEQKMKCTDKSISLRDFLEQFL